MENKTFDALLLPVRQDIDRIDKQLLQLFIERMACSERVAEIKRQAGIPVLNAAREQAILDRVRQEAGIYGDSAAALYSAIMAISRARQHAMLESGGALRALEKDSPRAMKQNPRIICQGAPGAYSHSAANRLFPGAEPAFLPGFCDVFEAVRSGAGDYGVVPVENSDAGSVSEVYDLILRHRMFIVGAADIPVRHCLCCAPGTGPVRRVISKQEALAQCSAFLTQRGIEAPSARRRPPRSTGWKRSPRTSRTPATTARVLSSLRARPCCPTMRTRSACAFRCRTRRARCTARLSALRSAG